MRTFDGTRLVAAISILASACVTKADLPDAEDGTGTDSSGETDTLGETDDDSDTSPSSETASASGTQTATASGTGTGTDTDGPTPGEGPNAVDILFVIDNSMSMAGAQGKLQSALPSLTNALETTGIDYRVGFTTTDNGNPWCTSEATAGHLLLSSCRSRALDFGDLAGEDHFDTACADHCSVDALTTTNGVPWVESANGSNLGNEVSPTDAISCALPQGIVGCGFESPLEAAHRVLLNSRDAAAPEFGFIRDAAHLMVVVLTDEADCSAAADDIFLSVDMGGNEVFWPENLESPSPTSAICWNAGVACTGGPGEYDDCLAQDYDIDGQPTGDRGAAVLQPLSRYESELDSVRDAKAESGGHVFLFGLVGVPLDYPSTRTIPYADGADTDVSAFGIAPGCTSGSHAAVPPARIRQMFEDAAVTDASPLHSICSESYGSAMTEMVAQVNSFVGM